MKKITSLILASLTIIAIFSSCSKSPESFETAMDMVEAVKQNIQHVGPDEFKGILDAGENFLLIDVREPGEFNSGFIPGAINIARGLLEFRIAKSSYWEEEMLYMPEKADLIIICCKLGHRGALCADALKKLGYTNVKNLDGGFKNWQSQFPDLVEKNEAAITNSGLEGMSSSSDDGGGC